MSDALAVHGTQAIEPSNMRELEALAKHAAESRFFGAANQAQAVLLMMCGKDLGLSYTQSLRAFHVVEGRPTLSADGMAAVCLARKDVCAFFRVVEATETKATVETQRVGDPPRRLTFTLEEAQRAGLVKEKSGWSKWPGRMCLARAKSFLARETYPDLLMGLYEPDEIRDSAPAPAPAVHVAHVVTDDGEIVDDEPDATLAEAARLEGLLRSAATLDERDAAVKELMKAKRAKAVTGEQFDALQGLAIERKKALAATSEAAAE